MLYPEVLSGQEQASVPHVQEFAERKRGYIMRMYTKGKKLLPQAAKILKRYQLPPELSLLLPLESAFQPQATSSAGAFGYWQFMDEVAAEFGLRYVPHYSTAERNRMRKLNPHYADSLFKSLAKATDDRAHFTKATHAAARYLKDRWRNLHGDILLVVASYNCGVGNVWQALAASGKTNPTFWDIHDKLPRETQLYVKNFIALNVIFANYATFLRNEMRFVEEEIELPAEIMEPDVSITSR
jgi:membrane-bound lytic murein transglycosylase D